MNKRTESLTELPKVGNLANLSSSERLSLRETIHQMEAREWIARFKAKMKADGKTAAWSWWQTTLEDIARRRGQKAADELRDRMNTTKDKK
jgi:hypothetical protein